MSTWARIKLLCGVKANKALDKAEDPREALDYSYQKQLEQLQKVQRGVAEVATARKRVELNLKGLQEQSDKLEEQAKTALAQGREDLARELLTRRSQIVITQITELEAQLAQMLEQEEKIANASQALRSKVEAFRTKKETIKAQYTAAQAQTRVLESLSGVSNEIGGMGASIQAAEDKALQLSARGAAIGELLDSGALEDPLSGSGDYLDRQLREISSSSQVDSDIERLKQQLGYIKPPKGITR